MTTYITYRNISGPTTARIKTVVRHFYRYHQALPASIAVNLVEVDAVRRAGAALGLAVAVEGNGECLAGEVWLEEEG